MRQEMRIISAGFVCVLAGLQAWDSGCAEEGKTVKAARQKATICCGRLIW